MTNEMMGLASINASMEQMKGIAYRQKNPAGYMRERMMKLIAEHETILGDDEELGVVVIGGNTPSFHLRSIQASDPDILRFIGKDADGNVIQLIQHHSQMGIVVMSLQKLEEKAYRVGFVHSNHS